MDDNCIFCKIVAGQIPSEKIYDDEGVIAFRDINPQAPTHIVIVPRRHIPYIADMDEADEPLMGHIIYAATQIARQEGLDQGYRIVINNGALSGQTVFHIHFHLLGGRQMNWPPG
jgi:histidine triad (HIT) family protein